MDRVRDSKIRTAWICIHIAIPGSGISSGEENGSPLQYSCLESPMDRGAWQATVHGIAESDMTERLTLSLFTLWTGSHLMWRADSLEKTQMLGKIEGKRRRGWQRMRWLDSLTDSGHKSEQTLGDSEGQGRLACCSSWGCKELVMT